MKYTLSQEITNPVGTKHRILLKDGNYSECPIGLIMPLPDTFNQVHLVRSPCNTSCRFWRDAKVMRNDKEVFGYVCLAYFDKSFVEIEKEEEKPNIKLVKS